MLHQWKRTILNHVYSSRLYLKLVKSGWLIMFSIGTLLSEHEILMLFGTRWPRKVMSQCFGNVISTYIWSFKNCIQITKNRNTARGRETSLLPLYFWSAVFRRMKDFLCQHVPRAKRPANAEHFVLPHLEDPSDLDRAFFSPPYAPCPSVAEINHAFSDCGQL